MREKGETPSVLRLPWPTVALLWSVGAALAGLWWDGRQQTQATILTTARLDSSVQVLEKTLVRLEAAQERFYTTGDANRDLSVINGKLDDHEGRIRSLERGSKR